MKNKLKTMLTLSSIVLALTACSSTSNNTLANIDAPYSNATVGVSVGQISISPFLQGLYQSYDKLGKENSNIELTLDKIDDNNVEAQIAQLDAMKNKGAKALIINLADTSKGQDVIRKYCDSTILVFVNRNPGAKAISECKNAYVVAGDYAQSGILQGLQVVEYWKKHPEWDKNRDGKIQIAMLKGIPDHAGAIARAKWATGTMENYPSLGVNVQKVFEDHAMFSKDVAKDMVSKWMKDPTFASVEVVLANSDTMALGASEALKESNIKLPIFGIDGSDEALKAVQNGDLAATIFHDHITQSKVSMRLATNLINGENPTANIPYQMRNKVILVPYRDSTNGTTEE